MRMQATDVRIDADEDGWHLIVTVEDSLGGPVECDFNIHAISNRLLAEAKGKLAPYWAEAYTANPKGGHALTDISHDEHIAGLKAVAEILTTKEER